MAKSKKAVQFDPTDIKKSFSRSILPRWRESAPSR